MSIKYSKLLLSLSLTASMLISTSVFAAKQKPITIQEQGSFAVGGTVIENQGIYDPKNPTDPQGQTLHGDHAYVFYQIPVKAKKYPLMFLHGAGQFSKTWETTPDGREGFQNIFLRKGYGVYLIDQPRRGDAGRSTVAANLMPTPDEQMWFTQFRVGVWPELYPGVKFPQDKDALSQYFRQMTPNTGSFDMKVISDTLASLYEQTGPGILVTHSQGGGPGWVTAMKNPNVKAIVAYEPGSNFVFPESEVPEPIENKFSTLSAYGVPMSDFEKLTRIPIIIYYGDYIPESPDEIPARDYWRACLEMAAKWAKIVNKYGGDATVIHLPKVGIHGNTHFPFSDLNNLEIADLLEAWLKEKKLS